MDGSFYLWGKFPTGLRTLVTVGTIRYRFRDRLEDFFTYNSGVHTCSWIFVSPNPAFLARRPNNSGTYYP